MYEAPGGYLAPAAPGMMPSGPQRTARPWERNLEEERSLEQPRADAKVAGEKHREVMGYALTGAIVIGVAAVVATVVMLTRQKEQPKDDAKGPTDKKDGAYTQREVFADLEGKK